MGRDGGKRILGWSLRGAPAARLADGTLDGIPTTASDAAAGGAGLAPERLALHRPRRAPHPRSGPHHRGAGSIGLTPRGERDSDTYGAPMRQVFFRMGEVILELIGQIDAAGEGVPGFFGLAMTVADLDAAGQLLGEHLGNAKDAVQEGRRIATLRHREVGMSVATAFMYA